MEHEDASESMPSSLKPDLEARRRGRTGLAIPWDNIPWWGIIVIIIGVVAGFSALTDTRYIDALYFLFDLPWDKEVVSRGTVDKDGQWSVIIQPGMPAGTYDLYVQLNDGKGQFVSRSGLYRIVVPENAPEKISTPVTAPSETPIVLDTSTPTFVGAATAGYEVMLYDDYSGNLWRIFKRMLLANGVMLEDER
jgi:hypothetical protein